MAAIVAGAIASGLAGAAQFLGLGRPHSPKRMRLERGLAVFKPHSPLNNRHRLNPFR
jgi:hypothetical protein